MNRQTRMLIVLLVALGAASVASFGVYRAILRVPPREVEIATQYAVVAARAMTTGERVVTNSVKVVAWPTRAPVVGGFATVEQVVDRGLLSSVGENEPLTEAKLAPREAGVGLPPTIPPGMRAMSVKVNEVVGVAGFVVPGSRVDLMVILRGQKEDGLARVVVSNVQVLTAGTRSDQENAKKDGRSVPSTVVTLMVSPGDAERIALAQAEGQIMLSLRNPLDTEPTSTSGVRTAALLSGSASSPVQPEPKRVLKPRPAPVAVPEVAPEPPKKTYTIEAIRAAKRSEEVVR